MSALPKTRLVFFFLRYRTSVLSASIDGRLQTGIVRSVVFSASRHADGGEKIFAQFVGLFFSFFFVAFATYLGDGELGLATGWPISIFFKNKISFSFSFSPWGEVVPQLSSVAIIWVPVTSEIVQ